MHAQIFQQAFIPRRLEEVDDHEADFDRLAEGGNAPGGGGVASSEGIYYQTLAGMRADMTGAAAQPAIVRAAGKLGPPGAARSAAPDQACSSSDEDNDEDEEAAAQQGNAGIAGDEAQPCAKANGECQHAAADGREGEDGRAPPGSRDAAEPREQHPPDANSSSSDGESSSEGEEGEAGWQERKGADPEAEKAARKEHKAAVKEANRERRKSKLKKHVKKRAVNKHKHK
jgi:RIO kinase 1